MLTSQVVFYVLILILTADFVFERTLTALNIRHSRRPLPPALQDIYALDCYARQQEYFRTNARFGLLVSTVSFLATLLMYGLGGFGWLDGWLRGLVGSEIGVSLLFFAILYVASDLLMTPFEWYDTFRIEERFGFNRTTPRLFVLDKFKGWLVTVVIGGGLLALVMWIYMLAPQWFWLLAFGVVMGFSLFMSMFYSDIVVPLFNRQTPLAAGELREAIEHFADRAGFCLKDIYVIDGSKRTTKANAYFTGLGTKKRIVLYDTLTERMTTDEIVAVLAHEIGHYKHRHTLVNLLLNVPYLLLLFFFFGRMLQSDAVAQALGGTEASFHLNALAFAILYSPVTFVLDMGLNVLSRHFEYQADRFAAGYGCGDRLVSALKKLTATSLGNLTPHPAYVFFYYSHPTLGQRIRAIDAAPAGKDA